jgi:hypothetical protein
MAFIALIAMVQENIDRFRTGVGVLALQGELQPTRVDCPGWQLALDKVVIDGRLGVPCQRAGFVSATQKLASWG